MSGAALRCAAAIRRVGGEAVLEREHLRVPFTASIQPRSGEEETAGPLGTARRALYTLYAPLEDGGELPDEGDTVRFREERYRVLRAETMFLSGKPVYRRAVLRKESP